jgi:hypothetical protein
MAGVNFTWFGSDGWKITWSNHDCEDQNGGEQDVAQPLKGAQVVCPLADLSMRVDAGLQPLSSSAAARRPGVLEVPGFRAENERADFGRTQDQRRIGTVDAPPEGAARPTSSPAD